MSLQVEGKGTVKVETYNGTMKSMHDVQYLPDLGYNLLNVGQRMRVGYVVHFEGETCVTSKAQEPLITIEITENNMFPLDLSKVKSLALAAANKTEESRLWHLRYGHLN